MDVSIGERWEGFVDGAVTSGQQKLMALRKMVDASIERGGQNADEDIDRALDTMVAELVKEGY